MSLFLGHKHSVIPKALFFTQRMESNGDLGAQLTALGLTQHRAKCPSPKVFFLMQNNLKLAAVWEGLHPQ